MIPKSVERNMLINSCRGFCFWHPFDILLLLHLSLCQFWSLHNVSATLSHWIQPYWHPGGFYLRAKFGRKTRWILTSTQKRKKRDKVYVGQNYTWIRLRWFFTLSVPMICIFQGACNSDGSRVVDWGGLIIMFLGVALTGARVLFDGSSLKRDFQILICPFS